MEEGSVSMAHVLDKDLDRVLFSEEELSRRVAELGAEITRDYAGKEPLLVGILRGSARWILWRCPPTGREPPAPVR